MKKRFFLFTAVFLCAAAGISAENSAENNNKTAVEGEEIVISASKLSTTSEKSGLSVTVIDSKQIEKSGASKVYELLKDQKGISVSKNSNFGGSSSVFMRGANSEHTVVLIDGVKVNDPTSPSGGFDFANLPLNNIERIEIIRGSQSVVHGSDALGGVINIVTKKAKGDEANFYMGYGRYNSRNAALSVSHIGEKTNFSMGASYEKSDAFSKAKAKSGSFENDEYSNISFNAQGGYDYNEMIGVELYSSFNRSEYELDEAGYYDDENSTQKNNTFTVGSGLKFSPIENLLLKSNISYFYMNKALRNDADSSDVENPANPSDVSFSTFSGDRKKTEFSAEYQYDYYRIIAGYEYSTESCDNNYSSAGSYTYREVYDYKNYKNSAYAMNSFDYDGYAGISAGVRYTKTSEGETAGVWHLSAYGNIKDMGTRFRSSAGTGFKTASLYQLYEPTYGNKDLKNEKSIYYDFGIAQWIKKIAEIDAGCFYSKYKNRIDFVTIDPVSYTSKYMNVDKSSSKGLEFSASVYPVEFLSVFANYTYTVSRDDKTDEDLLRRPRHKYSAGINTDIMKKADIMFSYDYTGKRYDTFNSNRIKLDSYATVNAAVNITTTVNTSVVVRIDNLLNKEYEEVKGYDAGGINVRCGLRGKF